VVGWWDSHCFHSCLAIMKVPLYRHEETGYACELNIYKHWVTCGPSIHFFGWCVCVWGGGGVAL
jgi:hypothetical protein